jgi:hypothetical protein
MATLAFLVLVKKAAARKKGSENIIRRVRRSSAPTEVE